VNSLLSLLYCLPIELVTAQLKAFHDREFPLIVIEISPNFSYILVFYKHHKVIRSFDSVIHKTRWPVFAFFSFLQKTFSKKNRRQPLFKSRDSSEINGLEVRVHQPCDGSPMPALGMSEICEYGVCRTMIWWYTVHWGYAGYWTWLNLALDCHSMMELLSLSLSLGHTEVTELNSFGDSCLWKSANPAMNSLLVTLSNKHPLWDHCGPHAQWRVIENVTKEECKSVWQDNLFWIALLSQSLVFRVVHTWYGP